MDKKIESMGSSAGATVADEACSLAFFMRLSKAALSSPRRALRNAYMSFIISSSRLRKEGTVLPVCITPGKIVEPHLPWRNRHVLEHMPVIEYPDELLFFLDAYNAGGSGCKQSIPVP